MSTFITRHFGTINPPDGRDFPQCPLTFFVSTESALPPKVPTPEWAKSSLKGQKILT
jgi:hypothetical protein